jgi:hypothetical protein
VPHGQRDHAVALDKKVRVGAEQQPAHPLPRYRLGPQDKSGAAYFGDALPLADPARNNRTEVEATASEKGTAS